MELIAQSIDFIVNLDTYLAEIIKKLGALT